jgi:hypothetical protein
LRVAINHADSIPSLRAIVEDFFLRERARPRARIGPPTLALAGRDD